MPYRISINTDTKRINLLERSIMQHENDLAAEKLVIRQETIDKAKQTLLTFRERVNARGKEAADTMPAVKAKDEAKAKCRMYISHFFQVLDLWVSRNGEMSEGVFKYYSKELTAGLLPTLQTDDDMLRWGKGILEGEEKRLADGGEAMSHPSIAEIQPVVEDYTSKLASVQKEKKELDEAEEAVADLRPEVDEINDDIIAELEFAFRKEEPSSQRRKMRTYGVKYGLKKGEESEGLEDLSPEPESSDGEVSNRGQVVREDNRGDERRNDRADGYDSD